MDRCAKPDAPPKRLRSGECEKGLGGAVASVEWDSEFAAFWGALSLYCGDRAVAEELAQDALSRACATGGRFAGWGPPTTPCSCSPRE
jgi:hypothetical protein